MVLDLSSTLVENINENKENLNFIWYFAHLIVPLHAIYTLLINKGIENYRHECT